MVNGFYWGSLGMLGAIGYFLLGSCDILLQIMLLFMLLDYIAGNLRALYNKEWVSSKNIKGMIRALGIIVLFIVANLLDVLLTQQYGFSEGLIRHIVGVFIIGHEGISILQNLKKMGIGIPDVLYKHLKSLINYNSKSEYPECGERRKQDDSNNNPEQSESEK